LGHGAEHVRNTRCNYLDHEGLFDVVFGECGEQFDCEVEDVAAALLAVYKDYDKYIKKARKGRKWVDQYNCTNPLLRNQYRTLIKPKLVKLGKRTEI
jgi:hypothetical protein